MRKRYSTAGNQQSSTLFLLLSSLIGQQYFSISLDDAAPEVISYETKGRSEEWKENVLRNQAIRTVRLPISGKKSHKLVIKALDEGVILDQVMLYMPSPTGE